MLAVVRMRSKSARWFRLPTFLFVLVATSRASADITVRIESAAARLIGTSVDITVEVISTYDLKTVHAQLETAGMDLSFADIANESRWRGTLNTQAVSRGSKSLTVTATDVLDNSNSASVTVKHANPPIITIASPANGSVIRNGDNVMFSASCQTDDPAGCQRLRALGGNITSGNPYVFGTGVSTLQLDLSTVQLGFAADVGGQQTVGFDATDSDGQFSYGFVTVVIDPSPYVTTLTTVDGAAWDFDGKRVLFRKVDGTVLLRDEHGSDGVGRRRGPGSEKQ